MAILDQWAFAFETDGFDAAAALGQLEWQRTVGAYLTDPVGGGDRLAGLHSTHGFEVPVPGGTVRAGALSRPRRRSGGTSPRSARGSSDRLRSPTTPAGRAGQPTWQTGQR